MVHTCDGPSAPVLGEASELATSLTSTTQASSDNQQLIASKQPVFSRIPYQIDAAFTSLPVGFPSRVTCFFVRPCCSDHSAVFIDRQLSLSVCGEKTSVPLCRLQLSSLVDTVRETSFLLLLLYRLCSSWMVVQSDKHSRVYPNTCSTTSKLLMSQIVVQDSVPHHYQ